MSPLTVTSVASAAIISGDLIIGLSDGSIINCGRVQGPQGLDGPAGPIGAPGRPGQDGNTILTSEGFPRPDVGTNGDYIIDKVSWTIYGPKANGVWGTGTPLRGNSKDVNQKRDLADGVPTAGEGEGGGGRIYNTNNLALTGLGRSRTERRSTPWRRHHSRGQRPQVSIQPEPVDCQLICCAGRSAARVGGRRAA